MNEQGRRGPWVWALVFVVVSDAGADGTATRFQERYQEALAAYDGGRYEEAVANFRAAYAQRQLPRLLVNIGQVERKLGRAEEALAAYESYLKVSGEGDPEVRRTVEVYVAQAREMLRLASSKPRPRESVPARRGSPPPPAPIVEAVLPTWIEALAGQGFRTRLPVAPPADERADGWQEVPAPREVHLNAIAGLRPDDLWVVGKGRLVTWGGAILHWDGKYLGAGEPRWGADYRRAWSAGPRDLWVVGSRGALLRFDGATWSLIEGLGDQDLVAVGGSDSRDVWVVGANGAVHRWDGARWSAVNRDDPVRLAARDAWVGGGGEAWACGDGGTLHRLRGRRWSPVATGVTTSLDAIWANGPRDVWIAGEGGVLLHWDGKGITQAPGDKSYRFRGLWGSGPRALWAVATHLATGRGAVLQLDGKRWSAAVEPTSAAPTGVRGRGPTDIWVSLETGEALRFDGVIWRKTPRAMVAELEAVLPDADGGAWAVGRHGNIAHWDGRSWSAVVGRTNRELRAAWAIGHDDVWAAGEQGHVLRWDGKRWAPAPPLPATIHALWGATGDDVWAVGDSDATFHWDGQAWRAVDGAIRGPLEALSGSAADDVWAAGQFGVQRWDGRRWSAVPIPFRRPNSAPNLQAISNRGPRDIWVVNDGGRMQRWNGQSWIDVASPAEPRIDAVWPADAAEVWAAGSGGSRGYVGRWDGATWARAPVGEQLLRAGVSGVGGAKGRGVWIAGPYGIAVRQP